jgi:hypothetical protein
MILISEVASLGRDFDRMGQSEYNRSNAQEEFQKWDYDAGKSDEDTSVGSQVRDHSFTLSQEKVIDEGRRDKLTGSLSPSQRIKMMQLLDFWDEPETVRTRHVSQQAECYHIQYVHSFISSRRLFVTERGLDQRYSSIQVSSRVVTCTTHDSF